MVDRQNETGGGLTLAPMDMRIDLPGGWYFEQCNPPHGVLYALRTPRGQGFGINGTGMSMGLSAVRAFVATLSAQAGAPAEVGDGWQDIKTAPKLYQPILAAFDNSGDVKRAPVIIAWSEAGRWVHWHDDSPVQNRAPLILWRRLPTPSETARADILARLDRPADRPGDAAVPAAVVAEAMRVFRSLPHPSSMSSDAEMRKVLEAVWPRASAPTPPASVGLVDLDAVCKPWASATGPIPDWYSPLHQVFVAGMLHSEELLAKFLNVSQYEAGDGSEDFDQDATTTLQNILTAAKLYDPEDGRLATLSGQTGGAVPAGNLPSVEALAEALYGVLPRAEPWSIIATSTQGWHRVRVAEYRNRATNLRARLAEQPGRGPCRGCDGTGRVDTDTGGNFYQGECRHCAGEGQQPGGGPVAPGVGVKILEAADCFGHPRGAAFALTCEWPDGTETIEHVSAQAALALGYDPSASEAAALDGAPSGREG